MIDSTDTLQVNKFARRERHMRVFSKAMVVRNYAGEVLSLIFSPFAKAFKESSFVAVLQKSLESVSNFISEKLPVSPQKRLLFQSAVLSVCAVTVMSFSTVGGAASASMHYFVDYGDVNPVNGSILVSDEYGYLVKMNPQTNQSNRVGMTDYAVHTVASGETLSTIAAQYGVSMDTIKWENNLSNANSIRVGQNLLVPPVDGIGYSVKRGETLSSIAKKYEITVDSIIAQNALNGDTITPGQNLFLPGAEPIVPSPVIVAQAPRTTSTASVSGTSPVAAVSAAPSNAAPATGRPFIYPTRGAITQGYRAGHYALDIADRSRPPVWSAASGTVVTSSVGTWGGGYGNHVIVDHGNGLRTLYAHLGSVNVSAGQWVNQGDVLGMMGNTGRVYGATGIHLHWEVHLNGVRQNPRNYY